MSQLLLLIIPTATVMRMTKWHNYKKTMVRLDVIALKGVRKAGVR